ncbi:hypothetical protein THOB06_400010 [Vibrio rotiferianus]|nr:hypothetical protein THOG10_410010 [Vibrio rotiferianus]CAH1589745.1 hypothetical protein THOB06_400010 [Vibrio rotiferianus]
MRLVLKHFSYAISEHLFTVIGITYSRNEEGWQKPTFFIYA